MTGICNIQGVDLDSDYLLGLKEIVSRTKNRRTNLGSLSGNIAGTRRGRGSIFYDVRPWTEGDDVRHIDCYKTAKTGAPHIRTVHEDRENKLLIIADFRPSMYFGTRRALRSVAAAETLSLSGWRAIAMQGHVGLAVATSRGTTFLGWAHDGHKFAVLLSKVATLHAEAKDWSAGHEPEMSDVLEVAQRASGSAAIMVATALDAPGENFDQVAALTSKRRNLLFLLISDKFERAPLSGDYPFCSRDGQTGRIHISRRSADRPINDWPERLSRLGAKSLDVHAELAPPEIARVLERFHDGQR